jgi:hypothetical protein
MRTTVSCVAFLACVLLAASAMAADPGSPLNQPVTYPIFLPELAVEEEDNLISLQSTTILPYPVQEGDLIMLEPAGDIGLISDVVQFRFDGNNWVANLYSSVEPGPNGGYWLADGKFLEGASITKTIDEAIGRDHVDCTWYMATGPGGNNTYKIDSVSVPEPSTFALLGVAAIGLAIRLYRRRK